MRSRSAVKLRRDNDVRRKLVRPRLEVMEDRLLLTVYPVTETLDVLAPGTLRWAIDQANQGEGGDSIVFAIPGTGIRTIRLNSALPTIKVPVTIDGTTQPDYAGTPLIQLDGAGAGAGANGLSAIAGSTTIAGLSIIRFQGDAIHLTGVGDNIIRGNYLGVNADGSTIGSNEGHGIFIASPGNTIGGEEAGQGNLISGNFGYGVVLDGAASNVVEGNLIGVDGGGAHKLGNRAGGVLVRNALNNVIGGVSGLAGNVISGNEAHGIETSGITDGLLVQGNAIGTDRSHTLDLGNLVDGIRLFSSNNTVGGLAPGAGNTIAFNGNPRLGLGSGVGLILNVVNNQITSNSIFSNVGLGINLAGSGNRSQQPPILSAASTDASATVISGSLSGSRPDSLYMIQFFAMAKPDDSGFGEGDMFLGTLQVVTDHAGNASFQASFPSGVAPGAFVTATATDPEGNTSQFARNMPTKGEADVSVSVAASTASPTPTVGETITFTLVVSNNGPTSARDVQAINLLPAGVTIVSVTAEKASWSEGLNSLSFYFGSLKVGESRLATIVVRTSAATGASATCSASVITTEGDPVAGNNVASVSVPLSPVVDLALKVTGPSSAVPLGQSVTYTVSIANLGPSQATGVTVTDILPDNVSLVSARSNRGTTTVDGNVVTTVIPSLDPNESPVVLTIVLNTNSTTQGLITNFATVSANELEVATENNTASASTTISQVADLQVNVQADPRPALAGQAFTYTVTLTNNGPALATAITLADYLPAGVTFISAHDNVGGTPTFADGVVTDELASLAAGGVVILSIVVLPTNSSTTSLTNRALVMSGASDPINVNDSATITTALNPAADLSVTFVDPPGAVRAGRSLTYTIQVTNQGPSPATGVRLVDILPANVRVASVDVSQGEFTQESGKVVGKLGTLAPGAIATMTVIIETSVDNLPTVFTTASVSSDVVDVDASDDEAALTTTVMPRADLAVTTTPPLAPLLVHRPLTYLVTVTNHGPSPATGVVITETLPVWVRLISAIDSRGSRLTPAEGTLSNRIETLASGESVTLTIVISADSPGSFHSSAVVTGNEDDDPSNNGATTSFDVLPVADLAVTLRTDRTQVTTGDPLTYTLTVTNQGPWKATGIILNQVLPPGQSVLSVTASQGGITLANGLLVGRVGDLAVGASASFTIVVVPADGGTFTSRATVSATELDPNRADNVTTAAVQVFEPPGTLQFASPTVVVNEDAKTAVIVVNRTDGRQGRISVNYFTVLAGSATPGADFVPVSGTVVFEPGETTKSFSIPVLANPHTKGDGTVRLVLRGPQGGAILGPQDATTLIIRDLDPDFTGPTVQEVRLFGPATSIQYLNLIFNEPLNPATATSADGYQLLDVGPDGLAGSSDDQRVPLLPPGYNASTNTVTLVPASPLMANRFYYVQASGMRDWAGNLLEAGPGAVAAHRFGAYLIRGTSLRYLDSQQTLVTLGVTRGGLLDLTRYANGDGNRLQLLNPIPQRTVLTGRARGGANSTSFTSLTGLGGFGQVRVKMNSPSIRVGLLPFNRRYMSPPAVDGVFNSEPVVERRQVPRLRRPRRF